jgi:hypothetical protein
VPGDDLLPGVGVRGTTNHATDGISPLGRIHDADEYAVAASINEHWVPRQLGTCEGLKLLNQLSRISVRGCAPRPRLDADQKKGMASEGPRGDVWITIRKAD